jgi:uncharacterized protein
MRDTTRTGEKEHLSVSELLREKTEIRARHIQPGQGQAVEVKAGELLQIETVHGKQVADFVAFRLGDTGEYLSTSATRATNANIIPQLGMTLYSNRRQPMFEIVEDTVGRHDMLYACCDPVRYEMLGAPAGHASCRQALTDALTSYGIGYDRIPSPINWFMNVAIKQRGELEIREPIAEAGDYVVLRALQDAVAAVSACPQDLGPTNAFHPTDLTIRVYRDEPLPEPPALESADGRQVTAVESSAEAAATAEGETAETGTATRRADRRAEKRAATAAAEAAPSEEPAPAPAAPAGRPARLSDTVEATVLRVEESNPDNAG